jgi:hypothetical protein
MFLSPIVDGSEFTLKRHWPIKKFTYILCLSNASSPVNIPNNTGWSKSLVTTLNLLHTIYSHRGYRHLRKKMSNYTIFRINSTLTLVFGCPANLLLIWLIFCRTSRELRIWRLEQWLTTNRLIWHAEIYRRNSWGQNLVDFRK